MSSDSLIDLLVSITLGLLALSFLITSVRIIKGPSLADRIVALDMLVAIGIGFIATIGFKTNYYLYIDIAIALGLVGFLSTVAFARFVIRHGSSSEFADEKEAAAAAAKAKAARSREGE